MRRADARTSFHNTKGFSFHSSDNTPVPLTAPPCWAGNHWSPLCIRVPGIHCTPRHAPSSREDTTTRAPLPRASICIAAIWLRRVTLWCHPSHHVVLPPSRRRGSSIHGWFLRLNGSTDPPHWNVGPTRIRHPRFSCVCQNLPHSVGGQTGSQAPTTHCASQPVPACHANRNAETSSQGGVRSIPCPQHPPTGRRASAPHLGQHSRNSRTLPLL